MLAVICYSGNGKLLCLPMLLQNKQHFMAILLRIFDTRGWFPDLGF